MRVIFFGQTGIDKRICVERLAIHCLEALSLPGDLENIRSREKLQVFHLEDYIEDRVAGDYLAYLDQFNAKQQAAEWNASWDSVITEITKSPAENIFMTLHATYFRRNRFFSLTDIKRIQDFSPGVIITLIDDSYECWHRIQQREAARPRGTRLRLRDVFLWRTVEVMVGDFLGHGTGAPHYVVAVKHPSEMMRRLIFDSSRKRVYASFPISSTRGDLDSIQSVNDFRLSLHERFTVFDPLTIDEKLLASAYENQNTDSADIELDITARWSTSFSGEFESMSLPYDEKYPFVIPAEQVEEVIEDIDRQIEARDYRLIDQVNAVAAFRPKFRDRLSRGVSAELQYAAQVVALPVHLYWDDREDGIYGDSPFSAVGTKHNSLTDLIAALS